MLRFGFITVLLVLLSAGVFAADLTDAERRFVNQVGTVHFCVDPDWAPFEVIDDTGHHVGIAADLLALVAKHTGLTLRLRPTRDWPESMEAAKAGRCQLMSLLNQTPDRDEWLIFTQPILTDANVIITREEHPFVVDLKSLGGQTMVLPKGTSVEERVRRDFPNISLTIVNTEAEAFQQVSDRRADMTLRSLIVAAYTIKREGWFNLKIAGQVRGYGNQLRIGVVKSAPMLRDILDKGVASISATERQQIIDKHITITQTASVDHGLVIRLVAVFALILLTSLFWLRKLNRLNTALKTSEVSLRQSQKIAGLGAYVLDVKSGKWTSSEVFDHLFGISPAYPRTAQAWEALIHPDQRSDMVAYFNNFVMQPEQSFDQTYRIIRPNDQAERWIHALGQLESDAQGQPQKMVGTVQDITEQKQAEIQLQLAKDMAERLASQQRQFIAMLSHEVRTPLAVIDATTQLLELRLQQDLAQLALLGRIRRGTTRLRNFFDNCLTIDRINSNNFTVQATPVATAPLGLWAKETAELLSEQHTCHLQMAPDLPDLQGDQVLLRILLMNLLTNALKYSPAQTLVTLQFDRCATDPDMCAIAVQDQGPGIHPDEISLIFNQYKRGRAAQRIPGAGLGLAVVVRIAQLHGGTVRLDSEPGMGARFVVTIPFIKAKCVQMT